MGRRTCAALLFACALGAPLSARGQSSWRSRLWLIADLRGEVGPGDVAGIDLGIAGVGIEWGATPTLRLQAAGLLLGASGSTEVGRSAHGGAGGELAARLIPFPAWPVRPYLRASAGLLLFLRQPFLPGGDVYDFVLQLGAGLEIPLGARLTLFGDVQAVHLSNGQGLGPGNPAFTGEGALLGAAYALEKPEAPTAQGDLRPPIDEARSGWRPGATFDAGIGHAGSALEWALRDRVAERLTRHALALMDIESGNVGSNHFVEAGIDLAGHWTAVSAGVHSSYHRLTGEGTFIESAQVEANLSPEASLIAIGEIDLQSGAADILRGGVVLRLFPIDALLVELGGGDQRAPFAAGGSGFRPYAAVDWQLPFRARSWQASLFVERQLEALEIAGARISWDMGPTLRELARRTGWRRLR